MKFLLLPLAFVAGTAIACPADGAKDAMAPSSTPAVAAAPAKAVAKVASKAPGTKVAAKAADQRKAGTL